MSKSSWSQPPREPNGFIPTLNQMGYMTSTLDPISERFVETAGKAAGPCLEIGAAYGVATLRALANGARMIANDLDERHLQILRSQVPTEQLSKLTLLPGAFPDQLVLPSGSLSQVLICRVLHFFSGPQIEKSLEKVFEWLRPGGSVYLVAETPYLKNFQAFIPEFEERKKENDPWPGYISDVMKIAPERGASLPPTIHFLDPDVLTRVLVAKGFEVELATTLARKDFPADLQLDGRESVGVIARKI